MALQGRISNLVSPPNSDASLDATLCDIRFRALLSDEDWGRLPLATWRRFSKRLADGNTAIYVGEVVEVRFSRIGWWLAQLARLIGGPLPTGADTSVPSIVTVTEDAATGGQVWTRIYTRRKGFPQVIHSSKRFARPVSKNMSAMALAWRCEFLSMGRPWCFAVLVIFCRLAAENCLYLH
jgi:hypothetical protein